MGSVVQKFNSFPHSVREDWTFKNFCCFPAKTKFDGKKYIHICHVCMLSGLYCGQDALGLLFLIRLGILNDTMSKSVLILNQSFIRPKIDIYRLND